ncbi:PREDICTED: uncharacterized protein LOC109156869 isoform X2 [Ipomoea nil]|uniref:uncharacterized protein LOC109156869 isoform X2 n=1 Tax=Ipomoea nil TaxID=35883 RepID=UPI000901DBA9|nr:PREDICTED: uncharacterized protein LOC109156869 isoform X2 [Ipomoea nil]
MDIEGLNSTVSLISRCSSEYIILCSYLFWLLFLLQNWVAVFFHFQDVDTTGDSMSTIGDGYVALFVRMLGLDNDPRDRREAIDTLWKYSLGGKKCVDTIMQFPGSVNLTVNLLKSDSDSAREAAAGLLRVVSSVNVYRDSVAESGAIEEITGLLRRSSSLSSNVKEQSLCTLWNLSVDEKHRIKMANFDLLHVLMKLLEDDEVRVIEAAGGVLANLTLSKFNHKIMIEVGVIPKLARLLKTGMEGSKVIRKEAKNALLELAKDEYNKILVMEEGLVLVPLVEQRSKVPSPFNTEEAKANAMDGQARQRFLDRKGAIEIEDNKLNNESSRFTLLPWTDGVARLVLILGLFEDESAVARAAEAIADASFSEHMRFSFMEAGAVNRLTELIDHPNDKIRCAVVRALERLSVSNAVCKRLEEENVLRSLINLLNRLEISSNITKTILDILTRILDPSKEMKSKFFEGPANFSEKGWEETRNMGLGGKENEKAVSTTSLKTTNAVDVLDSAVLTRLIDILKTSSPDVQRKVASILEFVSVVEPCAEKIISVGIESGLDAVFKQESLKEEADFDFDGQKPELHALEIEEAGNAISAASRLLTRLLDFEHFRRKIDAYHFTKLLRGVLKSDIPLYHKDWVAACLVKLSSLSGPYSGFENPINMEVTLYETIPRLVEQMRTSFSPEVQEAAVVELNRIISEGVVDSTRAVSAQGGIFPLVKLIENGTERAVEAGLAILYNLSMDSENHAAIIAAGAVPVLRRIVLSQRSHWTRALRLLRNLPT